MHVSLRGSSPSTMTAGIMLLTRARQLGFPLTVSIVGEAHDVRAVHGPAVLYAPVLASCGVGREYGSGATVVLPGPAAQPLRVTVTPHGVGGWFLVDRTGQGAHPATQAYVRLSNDPRPEAKQLGKQLRQAMSTLGMAPETAVLDVLFGAPVPPLLRLALGLRAGRAMSGGRGEPITRFLTGSLTSDDPLDAEATTDEVVAALKGGDLSWALDRLVLSLRDVAEAWVEAALKLAEDDGGRDLALVHALVELTTHLAQLPGHAILPPLGAAEDSVAVGLAGAVGAIGEVDANAELRQVFMFLGGRFGEEETHTLLVNDASPPSDPDDADAHLEWFCAEVRVGRKQADALWTRIFDAAN